MGNCLQRSFQMGFKWSGINAEVPDIKTSTEAKALAEKYGLKYAENGKYTNGNNPVLVLYKDDKKFTNDEYHAVFISDIAPMGAWEIFAVITGW